MNALRDRATVTGLVLLAGVTWLGFLVHASPRFPGSLWGGMLGTVAALLIAAPAAVYAIAKRSTRMKAWIGRRVSMKQLLTWHIYTSVVGATLAILHTAHKFDSPLGLALTAVMLAAVFTGYVGRFFLSYVSGEVRVQRQWLDEARRVFNARVAAATPVGELGLQELAEDVTELEYSVAMHDQLTGRAGRWLRVHLVIGVIGGALLALHVLAGIYYGLRWW